MAASVPGSKPEKLLPPLEIEAMKSLWVLKEGTVAQVQQQMRPTRPLAYTTVMTLLDRLAKKGAVSRRKQSRSYVYKPILERQDAIELALDRLVHDFFDDSRQELRAHLENRPRPATRGGPEAEDEPLDSALL